MFPQKATKGNEGESVFNNYVGVLSDWSESAVFVSFVRFCELSRRFQT